MMATDPKIKPCPRCATDDVAAFNYDSGIWRVECENCDYIGPPEGSKRQAKKSHNDKYKSMKVVP